LFTAAPPAPAELDDPKRRRGQAHRDAASARSRDRSSAVAEIGPPPPRNEERYKRYQFDLFRYLCECFPQTTGLSPLSLDHKRVAERTQAAILAGGLELFIMPRGFIKSTLVENAATWAAGYGHRRFLVPLGATEEAATMALDSIQYEFETNDDLLEIFPEACHAARALEGIQQRAGKQTIGGQLTRIEWSRRRCILPTVPGFAGSGCIIWPKGITANLRGLRYKRADGTQERPDFVLGDDLQTDESAANPNRNRGLKTKLNKTILRLGGHRKKMAMTICATILEPDDFIDELSKDKAWRTVKVPMLRRFADLHEKEWLAKYADLRTSYNPDDENDKDRAEAAATAYYKKNRKRMDAGGEPTWEGCYIPGVELSALQHAYNILIDTGEDAFNAECQNTPVRETTALEMLTAEQIQRKQSDYDRGAVPAECRVLTTMIDVHPSILYWHVWAFDPDATGYLIEYDTFPKQPRKYFAHRSASRKLKHLFPGLAPDATIAAGLLALIDGYEDADGVHVPGLLEREWIKADGVPIRIRCGLADANGEYRDAIVKALSRSNFAASLHPTFGKGITAKASPISAWPQTRQQRDVGPEWVYTQPKPGEIPGIVYDANYWKTQFHKRLMLPKGARGALHVHKANPIDHRRLGEHWTAEKPTEVSVGSRTVNEFDVKPNRDNHDFDAGVGNLVAGARCGIKTIRPPAPKRKKKRSTTYYG
jgi:hypothetical protein